MNKIITIIKNSLFEVAYFTLWLLRYNHSSPAEANSNLGDRVVLVCNGPSAKDFPYEKYRSRGYSFCCVNHFALEEELFRSLRPKFYCLIDPVFGSVEYQQTQEGKRLVSILGTVDWEMNIVCSKNSYLKLDNANIHYRHVNSNTLPGRFNGFRAFLYRNNMASCGFQNVSVCAIYYFVMSKATEIVLTGVENDWHRELVVDENNDVLREDVHFYGKELYSVIERGEIRKGELYKYFEWYSLTLKQHKTLAEFAVQQNVRIVNTCLNSYIDTYPKKNARIEEA